MLRRPLRINFRLTQEEHALFSPLMRARHCDNWSELCRVALRRLMAEVRKEESDNAVRQEAAVKGSVSAPKKGAATKPKRKGVRPHKIQES